MNIYEIDREISRILAEVDPETGELPESAFDELEQLQLDRDEKIENASCAWINLTAEAKAIREQEIALADRRRALERRADRIKRYVEYATEGQPFSSSRVAVRWRRSTSVEVDPAAFWAAHPALSLVRQKAPEPAVDAIKAALKAGIDVPGATLVEKTTMTIK